MSSNDDPTAPQHVPRTAAADVSFAALDSDHAAQHAESSSRAESRSSAGKRSSTSEKRARQKETEMEKAADIDNTPVKSDRSSHNGTPHRWKKSGGFLLDPVFANGHPRGPDTAHRLGKQSEQNGQIQVDKRRLAASRLSGESSQRSSPLSQQVSIDNPTNTETKWNHNARPPSMDPAQLVQMALNLSESRKRHVSSTLPVPVTPASSRRVVSALDSGYGTVRSASSAGQRASHLSDSVGRSSPSSSRADQRYGDGAADAIGGNVNVLYTYSPATLSRAEKARKYFELASEHRRLLEHLPPLKTDTTAPGNYTLQATSSPGSTYYDMTRIPSYTGQKRKLGRSYNPLQALRNRRLRNRERRPLTAPPDTWQETDRIKRWIDGVEAVSSDASYRPGEDQVRLPTFSGELEGEIARPETAKKHQRSETVSSVVTRPENGWTIEPAELLADTYWLEKDDNKTIIEDRHGNRIFPNRARVSVEVPRRSRESDRRSDYIQDNHSQQGESETEDRTKSRRRNILPIPGRLRRNHISRSGSTTSNSSDQGRRPPPTQFDNLEGGDENIGPLERHMRRMIDKDEKGELSSPELMSPDYWDSKHTPFPNARSSIDQGRPRNSIDQNRSRASVDKSHRGSVQTADASLSVDTTRGHRRSRSVEGRAGSVDHGMSSMDELVSDSPSSPVIPGFVPSMGMDLTPPTSKRTSPTEQKPKRHHHLPIFRSRSKERNNIETTDFASSYGTQLSPVMSTETTSAQPRSSLDSTRPPPLNRHGTTESNASSLRRTNTTTVTDASTKESGSSMGRRFLKGGRIGELVRNESSRLGDRLRGGREAGVGYVVSRVTYDVSDTEDDSYGIRNARDTEQGDNDSQVSPRGSFERERPKPKPKYYIPNLPSFKSPQGRDRRSTIETPLSEESDPVAKYGRAQQNRGRSTRDNHMVPPRINLPEDDSISNPDISTERANDLLGPGELYSRRKSVSQNDLSVMKSRDPRRDLSGTKRHWSISDQAPSVPEQANKVTVRDIARIRALLLASGIKAHEIYHKADTVRDTPLQVIAKAAETSGQKLDNVTRKEENIAAARALSSSLDTSLSEFENSLRHFQSETAKTLGIQIEELSHRAGEQLTKIVHETSDEADAFSVELTTKQPQEVKRVDEAVDAMFRQRRRQFRLVRRAGFKLLEWLVLGVMWWVWFVVVLFNTFRKIVVGILRVLRWLLWF